MLQNGLQADVFLKFFSLELRSQDTTGRRYFRAEHLRVKSLVLNLEYLRCERILINSVLHVFEISVCLSLCALGFILWIMASCFTLALFKRPAVSYEWVRLIQPSWTRSLWEWFHTSSISVQSCGEDQTFSLQHRLTNDLFTGCMSAWPWIGRSCCHHIVEWFLIKWSCGVIYPDLTGASGILVFKAFYGGFHSCYSI